MTGDRARKGLQAIRAARERGAGSSFSKASQAAATPSSCRTRLPTSDARAAYCESVSRHCSSLAARWAS